MHMENAGPLVQKTVKNFRAAAAEQKPMPWARGTLCDGRGRAPGKLALSAGSYVKGTSSP